MKIFEQLGFSENEEKVYLHLLKNGSGSIRQIAGDTGINRGTVYDALKELTDRGLVSHSQKKQNSSSCRRIRRCLKRSSGRSGKSWWVCVRS